MTEIGLNTFEVKIMTIGMWIKLIIAGVLLSMGVIINLQHIKIQSLKSDKVLWEDTNHRLSDEIKNQNALLQAGEIKYNKTQSDLDVAKGANIALSKEFAKMRADWKSQPLPKTCADAIAELKQRSKIIAQEWNKK